MKRFKTSLIILIVLAVSGTAFGVLYSLYYEPPPAYRPMVFYDGKLFWDERPVETTPETMEYIGMVNSRVPESEKPTMDFQCNYEIFMNAELYRDNGGNYYINCTNGKLLLLDC